MRRYGIRPRRSPHCCGRAPAWNAGCRRSQWSVGEAAAHLALANELMADVAAGRARRLGDGTAQKSGRGQRAGARAGVGERGAEPLAGMIVEQAGACLRALEERSAQGTVVTPLGPMEPDVLGSYLLTHMLGHGYDLARALGRAHMIDRERVRLTLPFFLTVMPRVTDTAGTAGLSARYAIRLWGGGRFGVRVAGGAVSVGERLPGRADCTILIEPVTFLLMALGARASGRPRWRHPGGGADPGLLRVSRLSSRRPERGGRAGPAAWSSGLDRELGLGGSDGRGGAEEEGVAVEGLCCPGAEHQVCGDIACLPNGSGQFLYLATVLDLCSKCLTGSSPTACGPRWSPVLSGPQRGPSVGTVCAGR